MFYKPRWSPLVTVAVVVILVLSIKTVVHSARLLYMYLRPLLFLTTPAGEVQRTQHHPVEGVSRA